MDRLRRWRYGFFLIRLFAAFIVNKLDLFAFARNIEAFKRDRTIGAQSLGNGGKGLPVPALEVGAGLVIRFGFAPRFLAF